MLLIEYVVLLIAKNPFSMVPNQYVIRATAGGGTEGDIAIDDVSLVDGECEHITHQGILSGYFRFS